MTTKTACVVVLTVFGSSYVASDGGDDGGGDLMIMRDLEFNTDNPRADASLAYLVL